MPKRPEEVEQAETYLVSDFAALHIIEELRNTPDADLAIDTEGTGLRILPSEYQHCIGISIAFIDYEGTPRSHYFALYHPAGGNLSDVTIAKLTNALHDHRGLFVFANRQYDVLSMEHSGIMLEDKPFVDILTMAHLCNENDPRTKSLDNLAAYYLDMHKVSHPYIDYEKKHGNQQITPREIYEYAVVDAELTLGIYLELKDHPEWRYLQNETTVIEHKWETVKVLTEMKRRGVLLNMDVVNEQAELAIAEKARLLKELGYKTFGRPAQLDLFIKRLGLPVLKRTPGGEPSFDKGVLELYDEILEKIDDPTAQLVRAYRGWVTAHGLLLKPYQELVSPDGRLRCSYNTHRTATGRLSSSEPNLQQISKDGGDPWNEHIKDCFTAPEGYVLLSADYSQLELRLATAYCGEELLREVFNSGRDIFTEMAAQLGMTRKQAKTLTYSIQYGAGVKRIKNVFGVSQTEAARIRANFWATYPRFAWLNDKCSAMVKRSLKAMLWSGRFRHFKYKSEDYKAMNSVIQGGAADIVERVMVRAMRELDNPDCRMLLQVHDALVFEVKESKVRLYRKKIKELMEDIAGALGDECPEEFLTVNFNVEVSSWGE